MEQARASPPPPRSPPRPPPPPNARATAGWGGVVGGRRAHARSLHHGLAGSWTSDRARSSHPHSQRPSSRALARGRVGVRHHPSPTRASQQRAVMRHAACGMQHAACTYTHVDTGKPKNSQARHPPWTFEGHFLSREGKINKNKHNQWRLLITAGEWSAGHTYTLTQISQISSMKYDVPSCICPLLQ